MSEPEPTAERRTRPSEAKTRTLIQAGAALTVVGIALSAAGEGEIARWLTLAGLACLVLGLHRFGRLGADEPSRSDSGPETESGPARG